jgi:hypothetical protein
VSGCAGAGAGAGAVVSSKGRLGVGYGLVGAVDVPGLVGVVRLMDRGSCWDVRLVVVVS